MPDLPTYLSTLSLTREFPAVSICLCVSLFYVPSDTVCMFCFVLCTFIILLPYGVVNDKKDPANSCSNMACDRQTYRRTDRHCASFYSAPHMDVGRGHNKQSACG